MRVPKASGNQKTRQLSPALLLPLRQLGAPGLLNAATLQETARYTKESLGNLGWPVGRLPGPSMYHVRRHELQTALRNSTLDYVQPTFVGSLRVESRYHSFAGA